MQMDGHLSLSNNGFLDLHFIFSLWIRQLKPCFVLFYVLQLFKQIGIFVLELADLISDRQFGGLLIRISSVVQMEKCV